jgi:hypothetical protein
MLEGALDRAVSLRDDANGADLLRRAIDWFVYEDGFRVRHGRRLETRADSEAFVVVNNSSNTLFKSCIRQQCEGAYSDWQDAASCKQG